MNPSKNDDRFAPARAGQPAAALDADTPLTLTADAALHLDPALLAEEQDKQDKGTVLLSQTKGQTFPAGTDSDKPRYTGEKQGQTHGRGADTIRCVPLSETKEPSLCPFDPDGHLTDPGLAALAAGALDEIASLEAAEHLGFCEGCMDRYTALLTGDALLAPPTDLVLPVARGVRQRGLRLSLRRYAAAAAAVALALGLWGSGVFAQMVPPAIDLAAPPPAQTAQITQTGPGEGLGSRVSEALNGIFGAAGDWCGGLFAARAPKPAPGQAAGPDASGEADTSGSAADAQPDAATAPGDPAEADGKTPNAAAPAQDETSAGQNAANEAPARGGSNASAPQTGTHPGLHGGPGSDTPDTPDTPDTARAGWLGAQSPARTPASAMRGAE